VTSAPARQPPGPQPFFWPVRVYYEDTDSMGLVYYANYLRFMERARTEWLRASGYELTHLAQHDGVAFVVRALTLDFMAPARFNDTLRLSVEIVKVGAGYIDLEQRTLRSEEVLATARVKLVCVSTSTLRPVRIPRPLATKIRISS
jgi:acyl-CoA thioester hydrolase